MYVLQITKEEFDMEARKLFKSDKGKFKPIKVKSGNFEH